VDVGVHLLIGSILERFGRGKLWLYAVPAFLSHAYVDLMTYRWDRPLDWLGLLAGSNQPGPMVRWVGFDGFWNISNIGTIIIILASVAIWLVFFRRYRIGILFSWLAWDGLWVIQELSFLMGFRLPLIHGIMMDFLTKAPVFTAVHVVMAIFVILLLWGYRGTLVGIGKAGSLKSLSILQRKVKPQP